MYEIIDVTGTPGGECYLVLSKRTSVLIDSGFGFSADKVIENIRSSLDKRPLDMILLTHSHYDHACGCAAIAEQFPTAKIACSTYAAKIFERAGALETMREIDGEAAAKWGAKPCPKPFPYADAALDDLQELLVGDMRIVAIETPGHTKCCMSFYFPDDGLVATSETTGIVLDYPRVEPLFIVGYQMTLDSISRLEEFNPSRLLVSHSGMFFGDVSIYFEQARKSAVRAADFVLERHKKGEDAEAIARAYGEAYYKGKVKAIQPEKAFILNAEAMIARMLQAAT